VKSRCFLLQAPKLLERLLFIPGIVFDLGIDSDLHVQSAIVMIWDDMAIIETIFTLRVKNTALAVTVDLGALFADFTDGVGLVGVRVDVKNGVGGVSLVRASNPGGSCRRMRSRVGSRERTTGNERTADGENDAHSHGSGENGSHACNNSPDGVITASRLNNEPEQDVSDVDNPDGAIEVEAIAEHQLPKAHGLDFERLDRAKKRETK